MSLWKRMLANYYRSGLRGSYRLTDALAHRLPIMQHVVVPSDRGALHLDLRIASARGLMANPSSSTGEDVIIERIVREGDTVFDVGAHFGLYTVLLSEIVGKTGKVYAFEPNPYVSDCLEQTAKGLAAANVRVLPFALSDRSEAKTLYVPDDASMASLSDWTDGSVGPVQEVPCETRVLDELVDGRELPIPAFIKCDVEGAELAVFTGAGRTLDREQAPVLLFELNRKAANAFDTTAHSSIDFLSSLRRPGYRFFEVLPDGLKKLKRDGLEFANILAVPSGRDDLADLQ